MEVNEIRFPFNINAYGSVTYYYDHFMTRIQANAYDAVRTVFIWAWFLTWPNEFVIYRIYSFVTVTLLVKLWFLRRTFWTWFPFVRAVEWYRHWRELETQGVQFATRNKHRFRVIYYWASTGDYELDGKTRTQRVQEMRVGLHHRKVELEKIGFASIKPVAILIAIPIIFFVLHRIGDPYLARYLASNNGLLTPHDLAQWFWVHLPWIPYRSLQSNAESFFGRYSLASLVIGWWFLYRILPILVQLGIALWERRVYRSGAQFIPAAWVGDDLEKETHVETMEKEMNYGDMGFVKPRIAAQLMASPQL